MRATDPDTILKLRKSAVAAAVAFVAVTAGCSRDAHTANAPQGSLAYAQGSWSGVTDGVLPSPVHFIVSGSHLQAFADSRVRCVPFPGGAVRRGRFVLPPATKVASGGSFAEVARPAPGVIDQLAGHFRSARSASGTLSEIGSCDTGVVRWVAEAG